jgi:hypothetical protein
MHNGAVPAAAFMELPVTSMSAASDGPESITFCWRRCP